MTHKNKLDLESILRRHHGLLEISIKVNIRDASTLSMVYTPGVATPCLDIQKDITRAYEFTNKGNSILVLTDSSNLKKDKWNDNAAMPYLEGFCAIYKHYANIDAYPIILDSSKVTDENILCDTVNAISLSYSGVELFGVNEDRMKKFGELFEKSAFKDKYAYIDTNCKKSIDDYLKDKKTPLSSHSIVSAIWRVLLDCHVSGNATPILTHVFDLIKNGSIKLEGGFHTQYFNVLDAVIDYVFDKKLVNNTLDKYNWKGQPTTKDYVRDKYDAFSTFGHRAWVEDMPKGYYMKKHTNPENADLLHSRNKGVIEIGLKIQINCPNHLKHLFSWENLDAVSKKIIEKPELVYVYTCKNNYGAIVTNGTAILGLGNIGALAGMPVMEGKSVLFKHFGGTDICPICIQEYDNDKLIAYIQRISPSFAIINLEDIKGPDCFNIENKLIETVECPMFHDDQHGTACVVLAGLINAMKLRGTKPEDAKIVMNGAGAAGIAVCQLLMNYGFKNFIVCDTKRDIYEGRPENMNPFKNKIAELTNRDKVKGTLADVLKGADAVIGLSGPNTISIDNVKSMAPKPIVFALANPTPEIFPDDAKKAGAYIIATGRSDFPNQINNSVVFPGIFRGTIDTRAPKITIDMKIAASKAVANLVPADKLSPDMIMPNSLDINTSIRVATEVAKVVMEKKLTKKEGINIDMVEEDIHSFFIDGELKDVV
jgi:malic enzyme